VTLIRAERRRRAAKRAVEVNIAMMRTFVPLRHLIAEDETRIAKPKRPIGFTS